MPCAPSSFNYRAQQRLIDTFEALVTNALRPQPYEQVVLAGFDHRGRIKHWCVSAGSMSAAQVHQQHLFTILSDPSCSALALAHNHPSGDPAPSLSDKVTTQRIANFCQQAGQILLEHVIVGRLKNTRLYNPRPAYNTLPAIF